VAFATAFGSLTSGALLIGFIQFLGGSDFWVSLTLAIPSLAGLLQIPGAAIGRRLTGFKKFVSGWSLYWRLLYIPLIALPLLGWINQDLRLVILFVCIGLASMAVQIAAPIYSDWIAELVPAASRGWYFSRRTVIATTVGVSVGFIGGLALDYFERVGLPEVGFTTIFAAGVFFGLLSFVFLLRMKDVRRKDVSESSLGEALKLSSRPLKDKAFRPMLVFTAVFAVSQGFAGPLFAAYSREVLSLPFTVLQLMGVAIAVGTVLLVKYWGFLNDRFGSRPMLMIAVCGTIFAPVVWQFTDPNMPMWQNAGLLIGWHLYNGVVWSGVQVTQMSLNIAVAKENERASYLAVAVSVQMAFIGVSPLLGSWLMDFLRTATNSAEVSYKIVFGIVVLLRIAGAIALRPVQQEGADLTVPSLKKILRTGPSAVRAMKALSTSSTEETRSHAAARVGKGRVALASSDLIKLLTDPSPRVRRQAAESLARVGDQSASRDLLRHIEEHPELVEEETLEALGSFKNPDSLDILLKLLEDPRPSLKRAAAKALGRLGDARAVEPLAKAASRKGDPDLRRAAVQALRRLPADRAEEAIGQALYDKAPSIRIAAAEAVSESRLEGLAPSLRQAIAEFADETSSEMAYSLGVVGTQSDLRLILQTANLMVNPALRRRSLMGAARLLGCEEAFYRLVSQEGISRDEALLKLAKGKDWLTESINLYSGGDEQGALQALADHTNLNDLQVLAANPVEEAFLAAVLRAAQE
jgi:HEAT repeat protein